MTMITKEIDVEQHQVFGESIVKLCNKYSITFLAALTIHIESTSRLATLAFA